jgi:hypothetical protein
MSIEETFLLEKYKYILSRKQALNESTFKIAAIYQALILGFAVAQYNVLVAAYAKTISLEVALFSSACLMAMLVAITLLILSLLVGGVFAWLKYRKDESSIECTILGTNRPSVTWKSILSWYETYLALIVLAVGGSGVYVYLYVLFPKLCYLTM